MRASPVGNPEWRTLIQPATVRVIGVFIFQRQNQLFNVCQATGPHFSSCANWFAIQLSTCLFLPFHQLNSPPELPAPLGVTQHQHLATDHRANLIKHAFMPIQPGTMPSITSGLENFAPGGQYEYRSTRQVQYRHRWYAVEIRNG